MLMEVKFVENHVPMTFVEDEDGNRRDQEYGPKTKKPLIRYHEEPHDAVCGAPDRVAR